MNTFPELETDTTQGNPSLDLTEEEATRYDRQMRLWGIEAQQRMRNATILVLNLRGVATEAIKNMVLAGIGKLIIVDRETVSEQDLGAGFFFRDGDVGLNRLDAAKSRIESLNPLVTVETVTDTLFSEGERLESIVKNVDLVCVTDWDRDGLIKLNEICRKHQKPFYAGGTYGLTGYIFCDLLSHDYLAPDRSAPKEQPKTVKATTVYTPLSSAIRYRWSGLSKRQTKEVNPALFFAIMGKSLSTTASHEFSPVCAIVGGMLAQDILKALGGREPPIGNFFLFDGSTGGGTVCRLNMP
ncbi:hypothetical protein CVT25_013835 [Psilocybe cyanescens]|uniref:Ubiquitin-like 1-activating enzyme E1A n=1 Tax=Psilocybe cyanescens TaxID=93625 RepID=A0A409XFT1_PSICY|nr:hypothetical protein CVT25_013835 [Psilocybe cyanescens]